MKVIFLDIDGVLNSDEYFEKINNLNVNGIEKEVDVLLEVKEKDIIGTVSFRIKYIGLPSIWLREALQ